MLITGTLKCSKCNKDIDWEYIVPQKLGVEPLQAESLNDNKAHHISIIKQVKMNIFSE